MLILDYFKQKNAKYENIEHVLAVVQYPLYSHRHINNEPTGLYSFPQKL